MMFERMIYRIACLSALCLSTELALAHHSVAANFDRSAPSEITGIVTAFHLRNPHSKLEVDVIEDDGTVAYWLVEWGTINDLIRRGVNVERIQVGDELTITLAPSRRLEHVGLFQSAILPDGSVIGDCGFDAFREALVSSTKFVCEQATGPQ